MLYKYTDSKGTQHLLDAPNRIVAANHIASTEFSLDKVGASEALQMRDDGVKVTRIEAKQSDTAPKATNGGKGKTANAQGTPATN